MKDLDYILEEVMQRFNFYKVREVMRFLDWTWCLNPEVPSVHEMKALVTKLFRHALDFSYQKDKPAVVCSGGFKVTVDYKNESFTLDFTVESYDAWYD